MVVEMPGREPQIHSRNEATFALDDSDCDCTFAVAVATNMLQSPWDKAMSKDQAVIDECWQESKGATITTAQRQAVIDACQMLEKVHRYNHRTDPAPRKKVAYPN